MNNNFKLEKRHILLGLGVDVSGSMEQSIRNQDDQNDNGFKAFRSSLKDLSKKVKREIEARQKEGIIVSVDVFAQAFGLKKIENCDLLSLIEFSQEFVKRQEEDSQEKVNSLVSSSTKLCHPYIYYDPRNQLESIALSNGIINKSELSRWIKNVFPNPNCEKAHSLVIRLYKYPQFAKYLTGLLPKNFFQSIEDTTKYYLDQDKSMLRKAKKLALEFANASEKEIPQIVIREIGDEMIKELPKRGNQLKSLEEFANILESQDDEIEALETLIYGNTPMCSALQVIQQRFRTELAKLPQNTISVLFILSDGEPTDGNPMPFANQLKGTGTYIVSCFLTNQNIIDPRKLFDEVSYEWGRGARLMFDMASKVNRDSVFVESLLERKWKVPLHPKLFVQANHTDLLNEFTQIIVSLCKEKI